MIFQQKNLEIETHEQVPVQKIGDVDFIHKLDKTSIDFTFLWMKKGCFIYIMPTAQLIRLESGVIVCGSRVGVVSLNM